MIGQKYNITYIIFILVIAVVGNFNRNEPDDGQFEVTSRSMFIHPQYQSGNGMDWDACLIKVYLKYLNFNF